MQEAFTEIPNIKKRYVVIVREMEEYAEQCAICDRWFEWSGQPPIESFCCAICNRECCKSCSSTEKPSPNFPMRFLCEDCGDLPIEDQLKIASLTKDLNQ